MARPFCDEEEPALRPVEGIDHVAACHYAEELDDHERARSVFTERTDDDVVAEEAR